MSIRKLLGYLPNPWLARDRKIIHLQQQVSRLTDWCDARGIELREARQEIERLKAENDSCLRYAFEIAGRKAGV